MQTVAGERRWHDVLDDPAQLVLRATLALSAAHGCGRDLVGRSFACFWQRQEQLPQPLRQLAARLLTDEEVRRYL